MLSCTTTPLLYWIPSHMGQPGNEAADTNAKEAAETSTIEGEPKYIGWDFWNTKLKAAAQRNWAAQWSLSTHPLKYSLQNIGPWPSKLSGSRRVERSLSVLRFAFLNPITTAAPGTLSDWCTHCNQAQGSVSHRMLHRPIWQKQREFLLGSAREAMVRTNVFSPIDISTLIGGQNKKRTEWMLNEAAHLFVQVTIGKL